jgi:hypothetical protein
MLTLILPRLTETPWKGKWLPRRPVKWKVTICIRSKSNRGYSMPLGTGQVNIQREERELFLVA